MFREWSSGSFHTSLEVRNNIERRALGELLCLPAYNGISCVTDSDGIGGFPFSIDF